jgi:hypothetical protein
MSGAAAEAARNLRRVIFMGENLGGSRYGLFGTQGVALDCGRLDTSRSFQVLSVCHWSLVRGSGSSGPDDSNTLTTPGNSSWW